jgi:hypothetical protein
MKETFIIRTEWMEAISTLPLELQGQLLQNLFAYHAGQENLINLKNPMVNLVWLMIKPNLIRNIEEYDRRRETSARNGKMGGRPPKVSNLAEKPKNNLINLNKPTALNEETKKPIESLIVLVPDSVSDSVIVSDFKREKKPLLNDSEKLRLGNFIPPTIEEVTHAVKLAAASRNCHDTMLIQNVAEDFFDKSVAKGWRDNSGIPLKGWYQFVQANIKEKIRIDAKFQPNATKTTPSAKLRPLGAEPSKGGFLDGYNPRTVANN